MRNFSFKAPDETSGGLSYEYCAVLHRNVLDLYIRALNFSYGYLALRADVWHPKKKALLCLYPVISLRSRNTVLEGNGQKELNNVNSISEKNARHSVARQRASRAQHVKNIEYFACR